MNDLDLMTSVRQSLEDVHMDIPAASVLKRGGVLRTRRVEFRVLATLALTLVVAISAALSVRSLSSERHTRPGVNATLAAWTVKQTASGPIEVTIHELADFAGLESQLRAYGIPALITPSLGLPPSCSEWTGGDYSTGSIVTLANESGLPSSSGVEFTIHPDAIPQGALLWFGLAQSGAPSGGNGPAGPMSVQLFDDTPACSG